MPNLRFHFPEDLLELIIGHLYDDMDHANIRACALVHSSWIRPARCRLFEELVFRNSGGIDPDYDRTRLALIGQYARRLRIWGSYTMTRFQERLPTWNDYANPDIEAEAAMRVDPSLQFYLVLVKIAPFVSPRLCEVQYDYGQIDTWHSLDELKQKSTTLSMVASRNEQLQSVQTEDSRNSIQKVLRQITQLSVSGSQFASSDALVSFLSSFSGLRHLQCATTECKLNTWKSLLRPAETFPQPLFYFSMAEKDDEDGCADAFRWLAKTPMAQTVRVLEVRCESVPYLEAMSEFVRMSTSLQELKLDMTNGENYTANGLPGEVNPFILRFFSDVK
jgi:hypothetical protein